MRNLSILFNFILLIAVGVLYWLHFKSNTGRSNPVPSKVINFGDKNIKIAYVNIDSINENYNFYKDKRSDYQKKYDAFDNQVSAKARKLQEDFMKYQEEAEKMSMEKRYYTEEDLKKRDEELAEQRDRLTNQLAEEQAKLQEEFTNRVLNYLNKYNEEKGYDFILGYVKGGGVLYANDSLNITDEILNGLNEEYKQEGKNNP